MRYSVFSSSCVLRGYGEDGRCKPVRRPGRAGIGLVFGGMALLAGLAGVAGCNRSKAEQPSGTSVNQPVPVRVETAKRRNMPLQVKAIGWAESYQSVQIKSRVDGHLTEIHLAEGQDVKAGDHLFTIDPRPFEVAVHLAEANLARDKATAEDAKRDYDWIESLFKQRTATEREWGRAKARLEEAEAMVRADQAALEDARLDLEYCTILSPIGGRAGDLLVDRGNMVKANDTTLISIEQVSPIYVAFSVAEQHISTIKRYMREGDLQVDVRIPGESGIESGTLTFLDNKVDASTGTIRLKATFTNENRRLWPGQFVDVTLQLTVRQGLVVVPNQAVQTGQEGQLVFVVKDGDVVEIRPVITGETVDGWTVIVEGIEAGEVVVTDGQLRLASGSHVDIKTAESQPVASDEEGRS